MEKGEFTKALTDLTVTSVEAGYRAGHICRAARGGGDFGRPYTCKA